jgi:Family 4 glycosyl hydrolase
VPRPPLPVETLVKLAVVGGGSTYTPELVDGMARLRDQLPLEELVLVDPDPHRLELVGGISRRIMAAQDHPAIVSWTSTPASTRPTRSCSNYAWVARLRGTKTRAGRSTADA